MAAWQHIYQFAGNMQITLRRHEKILFHILEFQIAQGATYLDIQLAPSKFNLWGGGGGASGQLLISNTGLH